MIRQIIKIDEEKCTGCGLCATACHEGAIDIVDGKAKLMREHYCDGLGDCLPACPVNAIRFEQREAPAYDEAAVLASKAAKQAATDATHGNASSANTSTTHNTAPVFHGCPGSRARVISHSASADGSTNSSSAAGSDASAQDNEPNTSMLSQWPVQIKLVPVCAPYFDNANLLIAADCSAYAYGNFHKRFIKNHITVIGCPKLDDVDYTEKLTQIIANNNIKSVTIVRMEVPCCGGIENAAKNALKASGKFIPWQVYTISTYGEILD